MSAELERRLQRAFDRTPRPTREATTRARAAALATLPPPTRRLGGGLLVVLAAVLVAVTVGAAALAATGNLHVDLGARRQAKPATVTRLTLPPRTNGIAVVAGGRLWLAPADGR